MEGTGEGERGDEGREGTGGGELGERESGAWRGGDLMTKMNIEHRTSNIERRI